MSFFIPTLPMKMEQCSETSAYKIHTPGKYPEESIKQALIYFSSTLAMSCEQTQITRDAE